MPKIYTDDELLEAVATRKAFSTNKAAAEKLKIRPHTLANRLEAAAKRGLDGAVPDPVSSGFQLKGTSKLYRVDEEGNYHERLLWVKTKEDQDLSKVVESLKEAFESYTGRAPLIEPPTDTNDQLLSVYPIADQHIGLMSWGEETGQDYDLKIGAERLRRCAATLITQSPPSKQAIILNLGDWQHNDDARNMTPKGGNLLDVDGRYMKVLTTGVQLMMDVVEMALQKHESVLVRNIPGNHDPHASIALTVALAAFYSGNPRVTVDQDPSEFFFHRHGQVLIGANHGHRMKPVDMALVMATQRSEDWGLSKYRHFYFGHIHHVTAKEIGGVIVESFQTLAPKDAWSHSRGFSSGQSLTSITLHAEDGEIGRHKVNV